MGIRNQKKDEVKRLINKTLDSRFVNIIRNGLNCSPFESEAILNVVKEVYYPYMDEAATTLPPGKTVIMAVSSDEPSGKPVKECVTVPVSITVHRGSVDDNILNTKGPAEFRISRIPDICEETFCQGGLLTREDLAYRIFYVSPRTITRDLKVISTNNPEVTVPLRSNIKDIGPVLTHRIQIVKLALEGKTTSEISRIMYHSPEAIANYLSTFARCAHLAERNMQSGQIAFLLRRGKALVEKYMELYNECKNDKNLEYHLNEMLNISKTASKKKGGRDNDRKN